MEVNLFGEVKTRVSISSAAAAYGLKVNAHNKCRCPFHNEKTPSFTIYPQTNTFYCFGCGVGGDVIKLVERLFGGEPLQAAKRLDNDFGLGLSNYKPTAEERAATRQRQADNKLVADYAEWERQTRTLLLQRYRLLTDLQEATAPPLIPYDAPNREQAIAEANTNLSEDYLGTFDELTYAELLMSILDDGSDRQKADLYAFYLREGGLF